MPIIVSGLIAEKGSLLIVENPEAHLHPSGQSRIGQFLAAIASTGVQVVIETHSEHVINGVRIAALKDFIANDKILINFLKKENGEIEINSIEVNELGDLNDFPEGFFDQVEQDLIKLIKLKNCLLYTSPSPRDATLSRMPSSA